MDLLKDKRHVSKGKTELSKKGEPKNKPKFPVSQIFFSYFLHTLIFKAKYILKQSSKCSIKNTPMELTPHKRNLVWDFSYTFNNIQTTLPYKIASNTRV